MTVPGWDDRAAPRRAVLRCCCAESNAALREERKAQAADVEHLRAQLATLRHRLSIVGGYSDHEDVRRRRRCDRGCSCEACSAAA
jgi:hypothetical protein